MLGKLVRWLRMLGQDTIYSTKLTDMDLIFKAKRENRILITRDYKLYQNSVKHEIQVFYTTSQNKAEVLANLKNRFGIHLDIDMNLSRCPLCNNKLKQITKQKATKKIKQNTLFYYNDFWSCPKCQSIYWQGSHWKAITSTLNEAKHFFVLS